MEIQNKSFLDRGKRGLTYIGLYHGEQVLVKEHNPASDANTIANEAMMLQRLNKVGVGPRFIAYQDNQLVREFVDGVRIEEFIEQGEAAAIKAVLREVFLQCERMDIAGINKFEMTHPYKHILITRDQRVVMIDFERCRFSQKPKNVTQVCQYVARLQPLLASKGVMFDTELVKRLGQEYKQEEYSEQRFEELLEVFE